MRSRVQQTLTTCTHMRWLEVWGHEHLLCPNHHPLIFNLQNKFTHFFFFLSKGNHGPCHAWVAQAFLSSYLCYSCSFLALKSSVWILSSFVPFFWSCSCCSKLEAFLDGTYLHQVSRVCFILSQLYNHSSCPCNLNLCSSIWTCVLLHCSSFCNLASSISQD